ncbi:NAD(P)-binding domain-containing protein [Vibrio marisflavi]|uniref:Pyrroline-5-carboxylate reductase n=1 Tax=Vibrio marisflavi CECT 7928 TaxID=634439 RepID=A0ABM9A9M9_9VIBR|nr:NAD(P)-binding domain-containing protein [Vibrio marisflavi]CAH0543114.1 Pyrroline-5-carboxylate reductase [Vibrio marisflavi CECT 7928]
MKIGIIGVGKLATAIVAGLTKTNKATEIVLSPRNMENSQLLSNKYECVKVAKDNQAVAEECDWIFLTLPPSVAVREIEQLTFKSGSSVISCVATLSHSECNQLIGNSVNVYKAFPLPTIADCNGPLAYYPCDTKIKPFLDGLGDLFPCKDGKAFRPLAAATSLIASHYAVQNTLHDWLVENDIEPAVALNYLNELMDSLTHQAKKSEVDFRELISSASTSQGLNEQAINMLSERGVCQDIKKTLDTILKQL